MANAIFNPPSLWIFLVIPLLWLGFGMATLWLSRRFYLVFPLSAALSLMLSLASFAALTKTLTSELLFFHLRLDALSAVFLFSFSSPGRFTFP